MRAIILTFVITWFMCKLTIGQSNVYHPFPESNVIWIGTSWHTVFSNPPCTVYDDYNLYISGDTTIGAFTYKKLYLNDNLHSQCPPAGSFYYYGNYWGAFRQDSSNRRVYLFKFGIDTLAYDFNLNVGDTLPVTSLDGTPGNVITSIDSVLVGNEYRKRYWLSSGNYSALIEGVGSTYGAFAPIAEPFESGNYLSCLRIDSLIVWTAQQFSNCGLTSVTEEDIGEVDVIIFPNPVSTSSKIYSTIDLVNATLKIFSTSGQLVFKIADISGHSINLDIDDLLDGVYFFQLIEKKKSISIQKVVVIK